VKALRLSIACGALLLALPAGAVVTATWGVETYPQWDAGDATSAFITSAGELRPGWDIKRTALEGDAVWSSLRLADGSVLLGSDAGGAIYKLSGDAATRLIALPGAIAVVALAQTSDGAVWAGAMPGNKLWKIDVATGKATPTGALGKDKDVETVWSLAAAGNTVYAGTGPSGKLFAVTGGAAKEVFDTDDKRITALTVTSDGALWLGTSDRALVFRFDPKTAKARAMADFAGNEVSSLAAFPGGVIAAANDLVEQPPPTAKSPAQVEAAEKPNAAKGQVAKPPEVGSKPGADKDPVPVTDLGRKGAKKGKGALFRISKDGRLEQLHALTQTYFTALAVSPEGAVYALYDYGIRCVIAPSFGDIFSGNAVQNGLLTALVSDENAAEIMATLTHTLELAVTVDLEQQTILCGNRSYRFAIDPVSRTRLLEGLDDIALTASYRDRIAAFKASDQGRRPWATPVVRPTST